MKHSRMNPRNCAGIVKQAEHRSDSGVRQVRVITSDEDTLLKSMGNAAGGVMLGARKWIKKELWSETVIQYVPRVQCFE